MVNKFTLSSFIAAFFVFALFNNSVQAQTTISTTSSFSNNNGSGLVTFNFENTNNYPVIITDVSAVFRVSGSSTFYIWYNTTPVNGSPGVIPSSANWTQAATNTVSSTLGSTTNQTLEPVLTSISLTIPANTTYGIAIGGFSGNTGTMAYYTMPTSPATVTFTDGGCNIITGDNISYGATSYTASATNTPRGFVGSITFMPAVPCSGQPDAGTLPDTLHVCPNDLFSVVATGATGGSGMTNVCQSRNPSGTGTWTDITGATGTTYNNMAGITAATDYRYITHCNSSGLSDTSNIAYAVINAPTECYCTPSASTPTSYYITSFSTTGGSNNIANNNTGSSPGGYSDYSDTMNVSAIQGTSVDFSMTTNSGYVNRGIYVDWNHNGSFSDPGELAYTSFYPTTTYMQTTVTGSIDVPVSAVAGNTRMRVRSMYYYNTTMDPCDNQTYGEAEDYTFNVIAAPPCSAATFPSSVTALIDNDTLCVSGDIQLGLDTTFALTGITYQWQSAPASTGSWTDLDTAQIVPDKSLTGVSSSAYYRCQVLCDSDVVLTSDNVHVHVNNPQLTGTSDGTRCGPGTVVLSATAAAGTDINWYADATGGTPLAQATSSYTTPYITATTTYYAAPTSGGSSGNLGKPDPVSTTGNSGFSDIGLMFDAFTSFTIQSVDIYPVSSSSTSGTVTIALKDASGTILQSTTANVTVSASGALNTVPLNFAVPVGTGYRLVFTSATGMSTVLRESSTANFTYPYTLPGVASITSAYTGGASSSYYYYFYNWLVNSGCEGPRQAVTATVTPGPAFSIAHDTVVCNDAITPVYVSSPVDSYSSYVWTPQDDLYTDAGATAPYTGGSADTVYFKSDAAGMHTVAVAASNGASQSDCAAADTARIWVQPGNVAITGAPDTICASTSTPSSTLILNPNNGYAANSIQWQESGSGTAYNDIAGENGVNYITPALYVAHYYKAVIRAQGGVCASPSKKIVIADPSVVSTRDSFHCGPGTVTLTAAAGPNSQLVWYDNDTARIPLGYGASFVTPSLIATDTFYVAGSGGMASAPGTATIGAGANANIYSSGPFYDYGGMKHQYLITRDELNAAGIYGGSITSLAFNVVSGGYTYQDFAISMAATSLTSLTSTYETGLTEVRAPQDVTTAAGWLTMDFDNPFVWDGSSNIIVQTCWSNNTSYYSTSDVRYDNTTFSSTHYGYTYTAHTASDVCDGSGLNYSYTSTERPQMQFGYFGPCESARQAVIAHIYPNPHVDLGTDINECVDSGSAVVLDAGVQPNNPVFEWDNGSAAQVRSVSQSGTYHVTVTNQYTCSESDTISVTLRYYPEVTLSDDTTVCEDVALVLDAGDDGMQYFWNTGATTREITVYYGGAYSVLVTNAAGCVTADTVQVTMEGALPTVDGIQQTNNGGFTFTFNALNPSSNVIGYEWDFGDGSPHSYQQVPTHTYPGEGNYTVTLILSSACGSIVDSMSAHIVGINRITLGNNELKVYPNPTKERAVIETRNVRMERIEVYNVLGKRIYNAAADSPGRHELSLKGMASGIYTIQVYTDKGNVTRKLELVQ